MIADDFKEIYENYEKERTKPLKGNKLAIKMRHEFNENFRDFLSEIVSDEYEFVTKISVGAGNWVKFPWANVRYTKVSKSFQDGFYIYTLFDLDNKKYIMGLNQGFVTLSKNLGLIRTKYIYKKACDKFPDLFRNIVHTDYSMDLFSFDFNELTQEKLENSFKLLVEVYEALIPDYIECVNNESLNYNSFDDGIGDNDIKTTRYWLMSAGWGAGWWDEFYKNGEVAIGFGDTGDLNQYKNKEELNLKFQELYNDKANHKNNVHACWQFVHDMQIGDVIFVKNGMSEIIGRGIVESDYFYDTKKQYHKIRKVRWTHKGNWKSKDKLPMKTLTDITNYHEFVKNIKELFIIGDDIEEDLKFQYPDYNNEKFLEEVYIDETDYNTLVKLIENKKNIIIQGAPGVGKTFIAKRLAYSMMGVKDTSRVMMVQFHQSYSYEDFVMGYRPSKDGFELREGSFYSFCKHAEEDSENDYFFIIDEINRGNLSKIFGELFMLIENDKRGEKNKIQLLYSDESFFIPKNVNIIGLMNTADRSLAMIDYALRRRFAFFDLKPGFGSDGFKNYQSELNDESFDDLIGVMKELNQEIHDDESLGEGFRIGHSYLCNIKSEKVTEKLNYIVEYELIPLLKEYWFDEQDKINYWSDRLRSVLND